MPKTSSNASVSYIRQKWTPPFGEFGWCPSHGQYYDAYLIHIVYNLKDAILLPYGARLAACKEPIAQLDNRKRNRMYAVLITTVNSTKTCMPQSAQMVVESRLETYS